MEGHLKSPKRIDHYLSVHQSMEFLAKEFPLYFESGENSKKVSVQFPMQTPLCLDFAVQSSSSISGRTKFEFVLIFGIIPKRSIFFFCLSVLAVTLFISLQEQTKKFFFTKLNVLIKLLKKASVYPFDTLWNILKVFRKHCYLTPPFRT